MIVTKKIVLIAGSDPAGAFYGLQSLRQLFQKDEDSFYISGVEIRDWPHKPFRGLRIYVPGRENLTFFKRFLRNFMAQYKFNKLIIEVNAVMRFDRHPELNAGAAEFAKSMNYTRRDRPKGPHNVIQDSAHYDAGDSGILEKQELADIVQYANSLNIEVIPEIPSLTHSYYLLSRHRELAEIQNAEWPDTYCPSNPKSYDLLFDVFDEYIEAIKPKMVHIGHDEWRMPVGACKRCKGKIYSDLFVQDVTKIYNYLTNKGVKVAMWGDHFMEAVRGKGLNWGSSSIFPGPVLTEAEARKADPNAYFYNLPGAVPEAQVRKLIPKDILIFNWFWSAETHLIEGAWGSGEKNDIKLHDMGFNQVYGNFEPTILNWETRSNRSSVLGGACSTWSATTEYNFGKDFMYQFLSCVNLLWSTHWPDQKQMLTTVRDMVPRIRRNLSGKPDPSSNGNPVTSIDIAPYLNVICGEKIAGQDLSGLCSGKVTLCKKIFNLNDPAANAGKCAIAVGSEGKEKNPLAREVSGIKIGRDVSSLIFLHACAKPARNDLAYTILYNYADTAELLGWYEVIYDDGFVKIIPIRYGVNILEWDLSSENYCYGADPLNCAEPNSTIAKTFYAFEWPNARMGKKIMEINLKGTAGFKVPSGEEVPNNAIVLLALSAVEKREFRKETCP